MFKIQTLSNNHRSRAPRGLSSMGNGRYRQVAYNANEREVQEFFSQFNQWGGSINDIPEPYRAWVKTYKMHRTPAGTDWFNNVELFSGDGQGWQNFLNLFKQLPPLVSPLNDEFVRATMEAAHAYANDHRAFTFQFLRDHYILALFVYFFSWERGTLANTAENTRKFNTAKQKAAANYERWLDSWTRATNSTNWLKQNWKYVAAAAATVGAFFVPGAQAAIPSLWSFISANAATIATVAATAGSILGTGSGGFVSGIGSGSGTGGSGSVTPQTAEFSPLLIVGLVGAAFLMFSGRKK